MIPVIAQSSKPLYEQIYEFYRNSILNKQLKFNQRLPAYRSLARELGLGNNTVLKAYEQLIAEGYVVNQARKGLYVSKINTKDWQIATDLNALPVQAKASTKSTSTAFSAPVIL